MNTRRSLVHLARILLAMALLGGLLHGSIRPAVAATQIDLHGPAGSGKYGSWVEVLPGGNIVITDPEFDKGGVTNVGAVYLYNGASGALISTLTGTKANDQVGSGWIIPLDNGNYLVMSPKWDNGPAVDAGAVTWVDGTGGISGVVSSANSLVGGHSGDEIGSEGVGELTNGNYLVRSPQWDNGTAADAGAVTWGNGASGVSGVVSALNSLVGSQAGDRVGYAGVYLLSNGNYVVASIEWDNGGTTDAGAVTWGDGASGIAGAVSAANSLVGSTANDRVGWVTPLDNGNYVVSSPQWDNGAVADAGAVTWGDGISGITGAVSTANSLVGSTADDRVGDVTALSNGDYVVRSPYWDNGAAANAGAVTWLPGNHSTSSVIKDTNSLVGSTASDQVGNGNDYYTGGVIALSNGNYVVVSSRWNNGGVLSAGAVTWGDGNSGITGAVSALNSLVGGAWNDQVGSGGVAVLSNDNYVVMSPDWNNGALGDAGAATWGSGAGGLTGSISAANSLVGGAGNHRVGSGGVTVLSNGNYVVISSDWDNGAATDAGAVTWGDGTGGVTGVVSAANSLVGGTANDNVGFYDVVGLSDGDYVVGSRFWDNGAAADAGAATWGSGTGGVSGLVSAANSLVGSNAGDHVGNSVAPLSNGEYVVRSEDWDNGAGTDVGAVTWGDGGSGITGAISALNSLVGSKPGDHIGSPGVYPLDDGSYVVVSSNWDNGSVPDAGAITWSFKPGGAFGPVPVEHSVVGATAGSGASMFYRYDAVNKQLVVRRPAENIVTLLRIGYGAAIDPATDAHNSEPGGTASYALLVTNTGDHTDTFKVKVSGNSWPTRDTGTVGPLSPGGSQLLKIDVDVPATAAIGSTDTATIQIISEGDNSKSASAVLTTTAWLPRIFMPVVRKR